MKWWLLTLPFTLCVAAAGAQEAPGGRAFGLQHKQTRIMLAAQAETWVRVKDADGGTVFMRVMQAGDTFNVPDRPGLTLDTGNGRALRVAVDSREVGPLLPSGTSIVRRDLPLDPERLARREDPTPSATPVVAAVAAPATAAAPRPAALPRAPRNSTVEAGTETIALDLNKGTLVRLRGPAATVFVADPEIADVQVKSPALLYVFARKPGETVLYAVDERDQVLLASRIAVQPNLAALRAALRTVAPDAAIEVSSVESTLILTGNAGSAAMAENARRLAQRFVPEGGALLNHVQVDSPNQINLRVRIAEVSRTTLKELGVNWDALLRTGGFAFGLATGLPTVAGGLLATRNPAFNGTGTSNSIVGTYSSSRFDMNGVIDALANEGLVTVLAEPNLTALSGETASFLAGGEFPIPVAQQQNTISVEFKKFGVGLAFTPSLLDGDRINLKVRPEVSQLSNAGAVQIAGFQIPALTTRRAETTVELGSGQSFAIAGLLQNNAQHDIGKTPFLADLPVLGALFRSDRFRRSETELVIIVTPYVVRPVSTRMALPTDGLATPNDMERLAQASPWRPASGQQPAAPVTARDGSGRVGQAGFILE
jgi:pilus assembly protein CpaC